jgi:hypothetical protein
VNSATSAHPRFLYQIVRIVPLGSEEPTDHHSKPRRVPLIECAKCALVTVQETPDEGGIGLVCQRHRCRHALYVHPGAGEGYIRPEIRHSGSPAT